MDNSSQEIQCVFVTTTLDTHLLVHLHKDEIVSDFKEKLCNVHIKCFPEIGDITISALKVKCDGNYYHLSNSMNVNKAFEGNNHHWFIFADAERVAKVQLVYNELVEKKTEIHDPTLEQEEARKTKVGEEKKTKKRKVKSSDAKKSSRKKTEESVKLEAEVLSDSCAIGRGIDSNEKDDDISKNDNQQICDDESLLQKEWV